MFENTDLVTANNKRTVGRVTYSQGAVPFSRLRSLVRYIIIVIIEVGASLVILFINVVIVWELYLEYVHLVPHHQNHPQTDLASQHLPETLEGHTPARHPYFSSIVDDLTSPTGRASQLPERSLQSQYFEIAATRSMLVNFHRSSSI